MKKPHLFLKHLALSFGLTLTGIIVFLLCILGLLIILDKALIKEKPLSQMQFGISFSPQYAQSLGLDWRQAYLASLDDLHVKNLRIPTYWEVIEPQKNQYDFSQVDFMLDQAKQHQAKVILVVGVKQPRWPECHMPGWVLELPLMERQKMALNYVQETINRYKDHSEIVSYQVENEPFVNFGEGCDPKSVEFLKEEVNLVKRLDPQRSVIVTDSGESGLPVLSMQLGDIFGTTVYRVVHNSLYGYFYYPYPALFYQLKSEITRLIFAHNNQTTYLIELQTEPWAVAPLDKTPIEEQKQNFPLTRFKENIGFAQRIGFSQVYTWGVEWWYFMKVHGDSEYWDFAKTLFSPSSGG